jgi:hypothetical protein
MSTVLEGVTSHVAQALARNHSRRSFLGRVAKYSFAMTVGGAAAERFVEPALALACDCSGPGCSSGCTGDRSCNCAHCGHSVSCRGLTGTGGQCPSCTLACGSWVCSCSSCSSGYRLWTDCCANCDQCGQASSARCVVDTDGVSRPTCTYRHCYSGGESGCSFIVCRYEQCA